MKAENAAATCMFRAAQLASQCVVVSVCLRWGVVGQGSRAVATFSMLAVMI